MSAAGGTWIETVKDQLGICRWSYNTVRSSEEGAKKSLRSFAQANILSSSNSSSTSTMIDQVEMKKSELYADKVMHLGFWGPSTGRF